MPRGGGTGPPGGRAGDGRGRMGRADCDVDAADLHLLLYPKK